MNKYIFIDPDGNVYGTDKLVTNYSDLVSLYPDVKNLNYFKNFLSITLVPYKIYPFEKAVPLDNFYINFNNLGCKIILDDGEIEVRNFKDKEKLKLALDILKNMT